MRVLFVHNALSTFVHADLEILRSAHEVRELNFASCQTSIRDAIDGAQWCDVIFGWWATWHLLLPILLAKAQDKSVIVVGGDYDIVFDPFARSRLRLWRDYLRRILGRIIFPLIDSFITFSDYSLSQAMALPYIRDCQVCRIYLGLPDIAVDYPLFKKDIVLSVGRVSQYEILRKGLGTFVKSATMLPWYDFQLVGAWKDSAVETLRCWNNDNVTYTGFLPRPELLRAMNEAKVYVQVSYREGFGMALAEAMLFRCVPVVTEKGSLPEVVGDTGIYVPYGDPVATSEGIQAAMHRRDELGQRARNRILSMFPLHRREEQLLALVHDVYTR